MARKRFWFAGLALVALLLATACGSSAGTSSSSSSGAPSGASNSSGGSSGSTESSQPKQAEAPKPSYPEKPIQVIVSHGAGGSTDIPGRLIQPYAEKTLGVPLVFENMTGAGGAIARNHVFKANPDGYTIMVTQLPSLDSGVYTGTVEYEPLEFTHIYSITGRDFLGTVVPSNSPYKTLDELLKATETTELTVGGTAGASLIAVAFYQDMGKKFRYVPFNSAAEVATAVAGNQIDVGVSNVSAFAPLEEQGLLNILAVHGDERHPGYDKYPSVVELGWPDLTVGQVTAIFGPPNMPAEIVKVLGDGLIEAGKDPKFIADVEGAKLNTQPMGPEDFKKFHERIHGQIESIKDVLIALSGAK